MRTSSGAKDSGTEEVAVGIAAGSVGVGTTGVNVGVAVAVIIGKLVAVISSSCCREAIPQALKNKLRVIEDIIDICFDIFISTHSHN
jgi:hypothetical protein